MAMNTQKDSAGRGAARRSSGAGVAKPESAGATSAEPGGAVASVQATDKPATGKRDRRRDNAEATRAALIGAGRKLFGELGFEATSVGALCAEAGVTTGALYHHYRDKKGLFAAVAEQLDAGLVKLAQRASAKALSDRGDPWQAFLASIDAFLTAGLDHRGRRIGLTDAPAVLGTAQWTEIRERHGLGAMIAIVRQLQQLGVMVAGSPERIARIILGVLYGAVESLPTSAVDSGAGLSEAQALARRLLQGVRAS